MELYTYYRSQASQAALDAAYDQAVYAPNREQLIKRRSRDSELARLRVGEPERLAYGPANTGPWPIWW